jgi:hypothetical protein
VIIILSDNSLFLLIKDKNSLYVPPISILITLTWKDNYREAAYVWQYILLSNISFTHCYYQRITISLKAWIFNNNFILLLKQFIIILFYINFFFLWNCFFFTLIKDYNVNDWNHGIWSNDASLKFMVKSLFVFSINFFPRQAEKD